LATTDRDTPIPTSQSSPTTSASSSPTSSATTASPRPTPEDSSGGGSPFDVANSSDSRQLGARWMEAMAVALGLGLLLLQ
jgi:hypothetical protein